MKTAIYLFVLIALFNSFSEPHDVKVHREIYKNGKIVKSDYSYGFVQVNTNRTGYVVDGKIIPVDSLVFTCGSETKYKPAKIKP